MLLENHTIEKYYHYIVIKKTSKKNKIILIAAVGNFAQQVSSDCYICAQYKVKEG